MDAGFEGWGDPLMAWVVDTCVLIDILDDDPRFGKTSAMLLQDNLKDGLVVAPVSYIELAPAFMGNQQTQKDFLNKMLAVYDEPWTWEDTVAANAAWARYVHEKQMGNISKRPIADILIGAFASRFNGIITRNDKDFRPVFPDLAIIAPS
jgi:predicted nucleic acid-binding protein